MIDEAKLLKGQPFKVNNIIVKHPTIDEILEFGEVNYLSIINLFVCKPYDFMVQLDDIGFDYDEVDNYDLFIMLFQSGNYNEGLKWLLDIDDFELNKNMQNDMLVLYSPSKNAIIDKYIYEQIKQYLVTINCINIKTPFNPANMITKKAIIDRERKKQKRQKKQEFKSNLKNQISSLVWGNTSGYTYENVWNLSVYQFNEGLIRIGKIKEFNNVMSGYYFGTVDLKKVNMDEINWMSDIQI